MNCSDCGYLKYLNLLRVSRNGGPIYKGMLFHNVEKWHAPGATVARSVVMKRGKADNPRTKYEGLDGKNVELSG